MYFEYCAAPGSCVRFAGWWERNRIVILRTIICVGIHLG